LSQTHKGEEFWGLLQEPSFLVAAEDSFNRVTGCTEEQDLSFPSAIDFMWCWTRRPRKSLFSEQLFYWEGAKQQTPGSDLLKCWVLTAATKITSSYAFSRETNKI